MLLTLGCGTGITGPRILDLPGAEPFPPELQDRLEAALRSADTAVARRTRNRDGTGGPRFTNRLILEDSPYLQQHAHNPVNWYPWGEAALAAAQHQGKPIFLSIGYSTCHWCHVMEDESFENPEVAAFINRHFIAVKVDRERRPDVDEVYMTAVVLTAGHGGWPLSVFLSPEGEPFFGGTYYPPAQFLTLVQRVQTLWAERRPRLEAEAARVADAVKHRLSQRQEAAAIQPDIYRRAAANLTASMDEIQGGFGTAPKFPHEPRLLFLARYWADTREDELLDLLETTLEHMARGGLYDQVGGGFHRYATTPDWLVPHFEKMLYNQALLARVYLQFYLLTRDPVYARIVRETLDAVLRDLSAPEGAFYSATDADSGGEEGAFFLWTPEEVRQVLEADDADLALALFGVTDGGNFADRTIPHRTLGWEAFAAERGISESALFSAADRIRDRLEARRHQRVPPHRDEKIITAWNGMTIAVLAQAGRELGLPRYTAAAAEAAGFVWLRSRSPEGGYWRIHLEGRSTVAGRLDDYAAFGEGLLAVYDATEDPVWLRRARTTAEEMTARFQDPQSGVFFMTQRGEETGLFVRPGRAEDGAVPSGASMAVRFLLQLYVRTGEFGALDAARHALGALAGSVNRNPKAYPYLMMALLEHQVGPIGSLRYAARGRVRVEVDPPPSGTRGGSAFVLLGIRPGWHINAHRPSNPDLIPTTLKVGPVPGWRVRVVEYPEPVIRFPGFSRTPLELYEGEVALRVEWEPIGGVPAQRPSQAILKLTLQVCSDSLCLAPETLDLDLSWPRT